MSWTLATLLDDPAAPETIVSGFVLDHRQVTAGAVFGAFQGARFDAETVIDEAVAKGAIAVVARSQAKVPLPALHIRSDTPRKAFADLFARFLATFPPVMAAVTGTNGKTSVADMVRQLWLMLHQSAASIGTLGIVAPGKQSTTGLTTPDTVQFLGALHALAQDGVTAAVFEASSHGLDQYRIHGVQVDAAGFTNLSRDHLDYHGTMEAYLAAKLRLFADILKPGGIAVVWSDDRHSKAVVAYCESLGRTVWTVGQRGGTLVLQDRQPTATGQHLSILYHGEPFAVQLPLIGGYQAANALVAAGLVLACGAAPLQVFAALEKLSGVRGRLEQVAINAHDVPIFVDYAHTPDGLQAAIAALRPHVAGRLIVVFGCGGDRDRGKRSEMGRIATTDAEVVIVTDDNPRSEDAAAIRGDIMTAAPGALEIGDRAAAIGHAIDLARAGDIVLVAGKGHEQGQIIGNRVVPFDDAEVARACVQGRVA